MQFIHVNALEDYHPGYKDRELKWAKIYFKIIQGDPDMEMLHEIDRARLIWFILLELQAQKPIPLNETYLKKKGFDLKKRPISLSLKMLQNFVSVVTEEPKLCSVDKDKDKDKDKEKEKESAIPFNKFWELYDKKVDRKKCEPKWNRLSLTDQEKALAYIPGYLVAQPDKQFRKDPATFLNNYSWQNEIINKTPVLVPHTGRIIKDDDWRKPLREAEEKIKTQGKYGAQK